MRYFYRDTNTTDTDNWQEIAREEAVEKVIACYGDTGLILDRIVNGEPVNCSTNGGQIRAED